MSPNYGTCRHCGKVKHSPGISDYCGQACLKASGNDPNEAGAALLRLLWKLKGLIFFAIAAWLGYRWISLGESPMELWGKIQDWFESVPTEEGPERPPARAVPVDE